MALYKYVSFTNLKYLLDGSIRFTQPKAFNDPFELLPEMYLNENINGFSINVTAPPRENFPARLPDDFESKNCNDVASRDILNGVSELIGILCLSKNSNSLLMWSHYADEYKGAVVEFDEKNEFFEGLCAVQYEENRPKLNFSLLKDDTENIRISELYYKPKEWGYENEFRIARNLDDCKCTGGFNGFNVHVMDIPIDCIKSINMGERMPLNNQQYILGKIKDTKIGLRLTAIANWGYGFRYEQIKYDLPFSEMSPQVSPRTAHLFKDLKGELGDMARWMIEEHPMSEMVNKTL